MFCVICGTENLEAGTFCRHCGKPLIKDSDFSQSISPDAPKLENDANPTVSSRTPETCQSKIRKDGKKLFVPNGASFPAYCVRCGNGDVKMVPEKLSWLHPGYLVFLLLGFAPIVLIYFIFRKRVKLEIPLCSFHAQRTRWLKIASVFLLVGFIPLGVLVGNLVPDPDGAAWGVATSLIMLLAGLIVAYLQSPLQAAGIKRDSAVLQGASTAFLAKVIEL